MRIRFLACLVAISLLAMPSFAAEPARLEALRYSVDKAVSHAGAWLDGKDFKSLAQSADGLKLLVEVLRAQSGDKAWLTATGPVVMAAGELQSAARAQNEAAAQAALAKVEAALADARRLTPTGKPTPLPRGAAVRPLMFLLDSVRADAKIALLTGNGANAKKSALVLSELGAVVSNARSGDAWKIMAGDFSQIARAAAAAASDDPTALKPLFRQISESCDSCHDSR